MAIPDPPSMGSGPADYTNQGGSSDPFAAFDNRIRYNDMVRYQMISQYSQNAVSPATLSFQQLMAANAPKFQYA